ncbi:MAG TPA: hypothetical protein VMZ30_21105 [Pyrinomonadaceae bacterium]|nr:hypothetical protein [Pyrinomonadaceae bacterium]
MKTLKSMFLATLMACSLALLIHAQTAPNTHAAQAGITISAQDMPVIVIGLEMSARRRIQVPDDFTVSPKAIPSAKP